MVWTPALIIVTMANCTTCGNTWPKGFSLACSSWPTAGPLHEHTRRTGLPQRTRWPVSLWMVDLARACEIPFGAVKNTPDRVRRAGGVVARCRAWYSQTKNEAEKPSISWDTCLTSKPTQCEENRMKLLLQTLWPFHLVTDVNVGDYARERCAQDMLPEQPPARLEDAPPTWDRPSKRVLITAWPLIQKRRSNAQYGVP